MNKYIVRQVIVTEVEAESPYEACGKVVGRVIDYSVKAELVDDPVDRVAAGLQQFLPLMRTVTDLINGTTPEPEPKTQRPPPPEVPDLEVDTTDIDNL